MSPELFIFLADTILQAMELLESLELPLIPGNSASTAHQVAENLPLKIARLLGQNSHPLAIQPHPLIADPQAVPQLDGGTKLSR